MKTLAELGQVLFSFSLTSLIAAVTMIALVNWIAQ
jgi:hypothetical protein